MFSLFRCLTLGCWTCVSYWGLFLLKLIQMRLKRWSQHLNAIWRALLGTTLAVLYTPMFSSHSFCTLSKAESSNTIFSIPDKCYGLGVLCNPYFIYRWKLFTFSRSSQQFWSGKNEHSTWVIYILYVIFCNSFFFMFRCGFPFPSFWDPVICNIRIKQPLQECTRWVSQ